MLSSVVEFTAMDSSKLASPVSLDPEEEELLDLEDEMKEEVEEEEEGEDEIRRNSLSDGFLTDEEDLDDEMDEGEEAEQEEPRKYTCSICSEKEEDTKSIFLSKASLRRHLRSSHASACYWACASCGAATPDAEQLKQHLLRTHKVSRESFASDSAEENGLLCARLTPPSEVRRCTECAAAFADAAALNVHSLRRHISRRLTRHVACPVCGVEAEDLTAHVRKEHDVDGVVCPHCGKILSKTCTLNRHIEQVHLNLQIHRPATCEECGKVFSKKGHLDRHVRTIHLGMKESSRPCPYCGKVFSTKSSLEPHIEMVHKGVRKACPECGKVLSDLWKHMRTVHGFYRRRTKIPKEELDLSTPVLQIANGIKNRDDKEIDEQKPKRRKTNSVGSKGDPDIKQE